MSEATAERVAQRAYSLKLLDDRQIAAVRAEFSNQHPTVDDLVRFLVRREFLTNYQVERLLKGETGGFFYGTAKVLYLVGTGTFSRVYRAVDIENGEIVAVKVLRSRFSEDLEKVSQFVREGEMGQRLKHPNIVPIYEVYSKGLTHYLVMEFVEGRNLRDFVKARRVLAPLEATQLTAEIAAGLSYAYVNGVSHRDMKLTNVLISSGGQPKLVDFGLASMSSGEAGALEHLNPRTVDYAGLERATGAKKDDSRSDIFFLGCMYYHMLTGTPALEETRDRAARLQKSRYLNIPPAHHVNPKLPMSVAMVVSKAMDPNPDRRFQTPAEFLVELKTLAKRLQAEGEGQSPGNISVEAVQAEVAASLAPAAPAKPAVPSLGRAVMVVESNVETQDLLRNGLKRVGYRVLVTQDPDRALSRFEDNEKVADCVIFSTGDLGVSALEAFNRFGSEELTKDKPAVLLLGVGHGNLKKKALLADHRVALEMPIKLKEFRTTLARLMPPKTPSSGAART
jgi:serine/threonine-protein kinase